MGKNLDTSAVDFSADFFAKLSKILNSMSLVEINDSMRGGIHYFNLGVTNILLYNAYHGGVQLIFNESLLDEHFDVSYDFMEHKVVDWALIIVIIVDVVDKIKSKQDAPFLNEHATIKKRNLAF